MIDDEEAIRGLVTETLADAGYEVWEAANGAAALRLLEFGHPDLIVLDMNMPVLDGPAFVAAYRRGAGPHAPILVFTAAGNAPRYAAELAAAGTLGKPFDLDDLCDTIERHVRPRYARRAP